MNLKNKFLHIRLERGYKFAKDFAKFLEINYDQYIKYELNERQPSLKVVYKASKKLDISIEELIYDEEDYS